MTIPKLLIETDFFSDVDDVGAIAVALAYQRQGRCELVSVTVNTPSRYGVPAIRSILAYGGARDVQVGRFREIDDSLADRDYAALLARRFPTAEVVHDEAVPTLRSVLARLDDGAATVVSIGFLTNLAALLRTTADQFSPLTGRELITTKVGRTVVMGGTFPHGREFNFHVDTAATVAFLSEWPQPIEFIGWEAGKDVITGSRFTAAQAGQNPIACAYGAYSGWGAGRSSWDLQAVDLAVQGLDHPQYALSAPGRIAVTADGSNSWAPSHDGPHRFWTPTATSDEIATTLDAFLTTL